MLIPGFHPLGGLLVIDLGYVTRASDFIIYLFIFNAPGGWWEPLLSLCGSETGYFRPATGASPGTC